MEAPASAEAKARVEQLLREAHIQRLRGQWGQAETLCRQALELAPDDLMAQEMLGDFLFEKGALDEALVVYRGAFERQPARGVLEVKIARAVLKKSEDERERIETQLLLSSPGRKAEQKRSALIATLLSLMCPGLGQLFKGDTTKGAIMAGLALPCLLLGVEHLFKMFFGFMGALPTGAALNDALAVIGLVGAVIWLYGVVDAASSGAKGTRLLDD